jgi:hypothetical protein
VLVRRNAVHECMPGVEQVLVELRRLSLGARAGAMDLETSGPVLGSTLPIQGDAVTVSSAMASSAGGAEPGVVATELFDMTPRDAERCRARIFTAKNLPRPFSQCDKRNNCGGFCGRHKNGQPQGLWDPPLHTSLPATKLEEARAAVAAWHARVVRDMAGVAAAVGVSARKQVSGSVGKARGKGRGGKHAVHPGVEAVFEDAASAAPEPPVLDDRISYSSAPAARPLVRVGGQASVVGSSLLRPRVRGSSGRGGGDGARRGDMSGIRAENEYVNEEMRRRGFQLQGGQWIGGQFLSGELSDVNLTEAFLREQFQRQSVDGSGQWGEGHRLGQ